MNRPPHTNDAQTDYPKEEEKKHENKIVGNRRYDNNRNQERDSEGSIDYLPLVEIVVHDLLHRPGEHDVAQIPLLIRHAAAAVLPHPARRLFTRSRKAAFAVAGKGWERRTRGVASSEVVLSGKLKR
jgi:hypothetical protein